jgi:NTE family protein
MPRSSYPFRNLIFEGGGVKGIAYSGALAVLEERGILRRIQRVGGASAGAINAALLALGYSLTEIRDILAKLDFRNFMDDDWGVLRDAKRLVRDFGWYKGDFFRRWMADLIEAKTDNPDATFADLAKRRGKPKLHLVATNLATRLSQVYSKEQSPSLPVADAVRRSMSIPLFFAAVRESADLFVDGGVLDNYPIRLFDREKYVAKHDRRRHATRPPHYAGANRERRGNTSPFIYNRETLGFRLDSRKEIALFRDGAEPRRERIDDFFDYGWALIRTLMGAQDSRHLQSGDWHRTVYINTLGVGTTDFDLDDTAKARLEASGRAGTERYFNWYDANSPTARPLNRPPD